MTELLLATVAVGIVLAFVADRRGAGAVTVLAFFLLIVLDVLMIIVLVGSALVENCDGSRCDNGLLTVVAIAVAGTTFAIGWLLVRALGRGP